MKNYILILLFTIAPVIAGASDSWPKRPFKSKVHKGFNYKKLYKYDKKHYCKSIVRR